MRTFKIILIILAIVTTQSCFNKDDDGFTPTLPDITLTGENTFGAYVDGTLVTPRSGSGTFNSPDPGMLFFINSPNFDNKYRELRVRDFKSGTSGRMDIHFDNLMVNGEGDYSISSSNCHIGIDANVSFNIRARLWNSELQKKEWFCSVEGSGEISILRYDFENRIVSGTFSCTAVNHDDASQIIEITQGRFDLKWDLLTNFLEFP